MEPKGKVFEKRGWPTRNPAEHSDKLRAKNCWREFCESLTVRIFGGVEWAWFTSE